MLIEDQRFIHENLERLEQAISDRHLSDPRNNREKLTREHEVAQFLGQIEQQSARLLELYKDESSRLHEIQQAGTGDPFEAFYQRLHEIKQHHRKYPNELVEDLERVYKRKAVVEGEYAPTLVDGMFSGEEGYGRYLDLTGMHEQYLNLPGMQSMKRLTYLQYLDNFDIFTPPQCNIKPVDKLRDEYFSYVNALAQYLEDFMRKTRPLEPVDPVISQIDKEFDEAWSKDDVPGWGASQTTVAGPAIIPKAQGTGAGIWCADCEKEFTNDNVYRNHLSGKKHIRAAGSRKAEPDKVDGPRQTVKRLKERAVAEREFRIRKLVGALNTERNDTKTNVERRQGMTEREREQELEALMNDAIEVNVADPEQESEEEGDDDKIYNPLKLPLAWDGKPIPFWLYKLHGLGVEYTCEICGNFVYMGRRAFDKHFTEARHTYGLKCLGITNTSFFREITNIDEAQKLWIKVQHDKRIEKNVSESIVQMEDAEGNVMPEKVYLDLQKQGLV